MCRIFGVAKKKWRFLKDALRGGGGVPTGAGLVDGGVDQGPWLQERVGGGVGAITFLCRGVGAWMAVPKRSKSREGVREGLAWRRGGCKGFGWGGVGGRGTGPGTEQISQRVSCFC